jgi:hypothetical protein
MPLQNRVDPFGELFVTPARGLFMGIRGGRFHTEDKRLTKRRWASKQWICCALEFKNRRHDVWGHIYTALFFLDEVTALSAGHRPCFECRRKDAVEFAVRWQHAFKLGARARAPEMDQVLHAERLHGREKRLHEAQLDDLPDGATIALDGEAFTLRENSLLHWTPNGYDARKARPRGISVSVLTPPSIVAVLAAGYSPAWHPSAEEFKA